MFRGRQDPTIYAIFPICISIHIAIPEDNNKRDNGTGVVITQHDDVTLGTSFTTELKTFRKEKCFAVGYCLIS